MTAIFLWQSLDGKLYWHEVRFLYASTHFSMSDLLSGKFIPHQVGGETDEIGASGFYLAKAMHIWTLKQFFSFFDPAKAGLTLASWISAALVMCSAVIVYGIMRKIFDRENDPLFALFCFILAPVTPYLSGKILSEIAALFCVLLCIWVFILVLQKKSGFSKIGYIVCAVFLTMTAFYRFDVIITYFGFLISAIAFCPGNLQRHESIKGGIIVTLLFICFYLGALNYFGIDPNIIRVYFENFYSLEAKSTAMSLFGILSFGGIVYFFMAVSAFMKKGRLYFFLLTWFFLTIFPMTMITMNYMVEPRYLVSSLPPLCGLGALGLQWLTENVYFLKKKSAAMVFVVLALLVNTLIIILMPYELDKNSMLTAVKKIKKAGHEPFILVPWAYTDFLFLRIMAKGIRVYNVNTPNGQLDSLSSEWRSRLRMWYGDSYIDNDDKLIKLLNAGSGFYLGWRRYPPIETVDYFAEKIGLDSLAQYLKSLPFKNHLTESWVWYSSRFLLKLTGKSGQYEYYSLCLK
jgi:hypothetical protein